MTAPDGIDSAATSGTYTSFTNAHQSIGSGPNRNLRYKTLHVLSDTGDDFTPLYDSMGNPRGRSRGTTNSRTPTSGMIIIEY